MRALMVPDVVLLVKIQLDIADNAQLSDDDNALMRQVDTLYAPRNAADAVKRLEEVKLLVNTSEGVGEYCKKFLRVHAEITQMNVAEATQVKKFLSNMRWADVRRYVEAINPATVKAAVKAALEAARSVPPDVPKGPQPQGSVGGVPKTPTKHNNQPGLIPSSPSTPQYPGGKPKKAVDKIVCFACGQQGHYAKSKECPKYVDRYRGQGGGSSSPQTKRIGMEACPRVSMRFNKKLDLKVLLDSGSGADVLSFKSADQLIKSGCEWRPREQQFEGVANAKMVSHREIVVPVRIEVGLDQPVEFVATFVDGDCGEEAILGYPTMKKLDLFHLLRGETQEGGAVDLARIEADPEDHVVDYDDKLIEDPTIRTRIDSVLNQFPDLFGPIDAQGADVPPFEIQLKEGAKLKVMLPRRLSPAMAAIAKQQNDEELALGHVQRSSSSVACREVMAAKKGNEWRRCIDYGQVNDWTVDMAYPLQHMYAALSRCGKKAAFAKLDLRAAYKQVPMSKESRYLTAFATPEGLFEYTVMPFGLKNAPKYMTKVLMDILGDLIGIACEVFIDDILIYGSTVDEFLENLRIVLARLQARRFRLKREKCGFGLSQLEYLGHVLSTEGITLSKGRKTALAEMATPKSTKDVRSVLGFAGYFRSFIKDYALITKPLARLCSKVVPFEWTSVEQGAFEELKRRAMDIPFLAHIDYTKELVLRTDASVKGIGGALFQVGEDKVEHLVALASKAFTPAESKWTTIEQECFAIFYCIRKWEHMLRGHKFVVETDHKNLSFIQNSETPKIVRWRLALQDYQFMIRHIAGSSNVVADALSRILSIRVSEDDLLRGVHNDVMGHHGVIRCERMLRARGEVWPSMRADLSRFIKGCAVCQKTRLGQGDMAAALHSTVVNQPFQALSIDFIGPLPEDEVGNKYILCMIDDLTRFVELKACREATAESSVDGLLAVFSRYGLFKEVRSDQGSHFTAHLVEQFLKLLSVDHRFAPAHTPKAMGRVERENGEAMRHLKALVFDSGLRSSWSKRLPLVQRILNSMPHAATGVTPTSLLFGGAVDSNRDLAFAVPAGADIQDFHGYLQDLVADRQKLVELAVANQDQVVADYLAKSPENPTTFPVGSLVLVSYPERPPTKLHPRWQGPFEVDRVDGNRYSCKELRTGSVKVFDVTRLKQYVVDPSRDNLAVSAVDAEEYVVDKIVAHRGPPKRKSRMTFKVRWQGYSEVDDTWEPYSVVKDLAALDEYIKAHPKLTL